MELLATFKKIKRVKKIQLTKPGVNAKVFFSGGRGIQESRVCLWVCLFICLVTTTPPGESTQMKLYTVAVITT